MRPLDSMKFCMPIYIYILNKKTCYSFNVCLIQFKYGWNWTGVGQEKEKHQIWMGNVKGVEYLELFRVEYLEAD
jgi:hypothetical protein